jgi:hypothetical protein
MPDPRKASPVPSHILYIQPASQPALNFYLHKDYITQWEKKKKLHVILTDEVQKFYTMHNTK